MGTLGEALDSIHSTKKGSDVPKGEKIVQLHYSKLHRAPYQYSHKGKTPEQYEQEVRTLKDEIKAAGKILQPLLVRKTGVDDYEIIGGQHRRDASELLVVEDGETKYEFCPCIITKMTDAQAEYAGFTTNTNWEKSDWHIMHEIVRKKFLIENYPEDFPNIPDKGRMIEKLAIEMQMAKSTVGEYLQIASNLSDSAMDAFENQQINKSAAVAIASLPHVDQDKLITAGVTKQKDIKAYKDEITEKKTRRVTITDTVKTVKSAAPVHEAVVPNFGTDVIIENVVPNFGTEDSEMEALKASNDELGKIVKQKIEIYESAETQKCDSTNCKGYKDVADTFVFYNKRYCMNCLYELVMDLADTGVITLDTTNIETNGIVIKS